MNESHEEIMLDIQNVLVSLDLAERFFCCDLDSCHGECCIEGDAGAPITKEEYERLKSLAPVIWDSLLPQAQAEIDRSGVGYIDEEGDLVTSIIGGKNCVFTCYGAMACANAPLKKHIVKARRISASLFRVICILSVSLNMPNLQRSITTDGKYAVRPKNLAVSSASASTSFSKTR